MCVKLYAKQDSLGSPRTKNDGKVPFSGFHLSVGNSALQSVRGNSFVFPAQTCTPLGETPVLSLQRSFWPADLARPQALYFIDSPKLNSCE